MNDEYPDGWDDDELIAWCQANNRPLPARLKNRPIFTTYPVIYGSIQDELNKSTLAYIKNIKKQVFKDTLVASYTGGTSIKDNFTWEPKPSTLKPVKKTNFAKPVKFKSS